MSELTAAQILYGATSPDDEPPDAIPINSDIAQVLYGGSEPTAPASPDTPADVKAAREADGSRTMYGDTAFKRELPDGSIPGADLAEWRQVATDVGANSDDVTAYRHLVQAHLDEPPTVEQHAGWKNEAITMMEERGFTMIDLDLARRFVARDPRLHAELAQGFGSHPRVVERVIQLARSARTAGRFK